MKGQQTARTTLPPSKRQRRPMGRARVWMRTKLLVESLEGRWLLDATAPAATPLGDELLASSIIAGMQRTGLRSQAVTYAAENRAAIVWEGTGPGDDYGVFLQQLHASDPTASGSALDGDSGLVHGVAVRVHASPVGRQSEANLAALNNGEWLVAWTTTGTNDSQLEGVFFQRFDAQAAPLGNETRVSSSATSDCDPNCPTQLQPALAAGGDGSFWIAWTEIDHDGTSRVKLRDFDPNGNPRADEILVGDNATDPTLALPISASANPSAPASTGPIVAWTELTGATRDVRARAFDSQGSPLGPITLVNETTAGRQEFPALAASASGGVVVVWQGAGRGDSWGIQARTLDDHATPVSSETLVNATTAGAQVDPAIARAASGQLLVAWSSLADPAAQRGRTAGQPDDHAAAARRRVQPSQWDLHARVLSANGQPIDAEFTVNTTTTAHQNRASITATRDDQLLVAWSGRGTGDYRGVFARRFSLADNRPPVVRARLAHDTGESDDDSVTSDPTLVGTALDDSPIESLTLAIAELDVGPLEITDQLARDGSFRLDRATLETRLGQPLADGGYTFVLTATDSRQLASATELLFSLDTRISPLGARLADDTGRDANDLVTRDNRLIFSGDAEPYSQVTLSLDSTPLGQSGDVSPENSGPVASVWVDENGEWTIDLSATPLPDGTDHFTLVARDLAGNATEPLPMTVIVDTLAASPTLDLAADSDTAPRGDRVTELATVTLVGHAEPGAVVTLVERSDRTSLSDPSASRLSTTADDAGDFAFPSVALTWGRRLFSVQVTDLAGNTSQATHALTRDTTLVLRETGSLADEGTVRVPINELADGGSRVVRFTIDAQLDRSDTTAAIEDTLLVSVVDPADPSRTLLDRGEPGTAVFLLAGNQVEYAPGLARWNGREVSLDLSSITTVNEVLLRFQLVSADSDPDTTVAIHSLALDVNARDPPSPSFLERREILAPGPARDLTSLAPISTLVPRLENVRVDSVHGRYTAELSLQNLGQPTGRGMAVLFPSLPAGVTLDNRSGLTDDGVPYVTLDAAIPPGGLDRRARSGRVRLEWADPSLAPLPLRPVVLVGQPNRAPVLDPIPSPLVVLPGRELDVPLVARDPDGDPVSLALVVAPGATLPRMTLTASGRLQIRPTPSQVGAYSLAISASDGALSTTRPFTIEVPADPVTTTRLSGLVLDTLSRPLAGVPVQLGSLQGVTAADGSFLLETNGLLPTAALQVHGELYSAADPSLHYPFIAEKLPLLLGHDPYPRLENQIARPIYLPALDVVHGTPIDPARNMTVTTPTLPGAAVFVAAGSLRTEQGDFFRGTLSITEVPPDLTPAALPENLFPDLVVTIQPGEMQFTRPAPLTLPNRAGYLPGVLLNLWSINPGTGLFDNVGTGRVSADGATIQAVSGGIRNSSWHFFGLFGPDVLGQPYNPHKGCPNCEAKDQPNRQPTRDDNAADPDNSDFDDASEPNFDDSGLDDSPRDNDDSHEDENAGSDPERADEENQGTDINRYHPEFQEGRFDLSSASPPAKVAPRASGGGGGSYTLSTGEDEQPIVSARRQPSPPVAAEPARIIAQLPAPRMTAQTEVTLHAGAVHQRHELVTYESLQTTRGLVLIYDSERADPRPIVHVALSGVANSFPDPVLVTRLTVRRGDFTYQVPGFQPGSPGSRSGLSGGEHFLAIPPGTDAITAAIQADLRTLPTGRYTYETASRVSRNSGARMVGTAVMDTGDLIHVNALASPLGAGWGLAGWLQAIENPDGSVLLVDGDGGELLFQPSTVVGEPLVSPPDDFTRLERLPDGGYRRTHRDQLVETFRPGLAPGSSHRLTERRDRHGNATLYIYDTADRLVAITDPVGLTTQLVYTGQYVSSIIDPFGRETRLTIQGGDLTAIQDPDGSSRQFGYDRDHHLTAHMDQVGARESLSYDFAGRVQSVERLSESLGLAARLSTSQVFQPSTQNSASAALDSADAAERRGESLHTVRYAPVQTQNLLPPGRTTDLNAIPVAAAFRSQATADKLDANGNVTRTVLDAGGQARGAVDGVGSLPSVARNDQNLPSTATDARGHLTALAYDTRGNLTAISDPISRGANARPLFPSPYYETGLGPSSVIVLDINGDALPDVVMSDAGGHDTVSLVLGRGNGQFAPPISLAVGSEPRRVVAADLNRDGLVDLVTVNHGSHDLSLLLGRGNGQFAPVVALAVGPSPIDLAVADLDRDGDLDLAALSETDASVGVLLGDGRGRFGPLASYAAGASPDSLAVTDVTGDRALDLVVVNRRVGSDTVTILAGDNRGAFPASTSVALGGEIEELLLADVTGDNRLDLLTRPLDRRFLVTPGLGGGQFGTPRAVNLPRSATDLALADLDHDGDLDLVASFDSPTNSAARYVNDGVGRFALESTTPLPLTPELAVLADVDLDGDQDLVVVDSSPGRLAVVVGDSTRFAPPSEPPPSVIVGEKPRAVAVADLNGDGYLDALAAHDTTGLLSISLGVGDGTFRAATALALGGTLAAVVAADLDGDSRLDLVVADFARDRLHVLRGLGDGTFAPPVALAVADGPTELAIADLNADGALDLVSVGNRTGDAHYSVLLGRGDGTFGAAVSTVANFSASTVAIGDLNDDSRPDLVIGTSAVSFGNRIALQLGRGDGTFDFGGSFPLGGATTFPGPPSQVRLADLDGDGRLDVLGADPSSNSVRLLRGRGNGRFDPVVAFTVGDSPESLAVGDLDGDGDLDVVTANRRAERATVLLGRGDGTLGQRADFAVEATPMWIELADLDGDQDLDFLAANLDGGSLSVGLNSTRGAQAGGPTARRLSYDARFNRLESMTDELGRESLFAIDPATGDTLSITRVIGQRDTEQDRLLGTADDLVTQMTYTPQGLLATAVDPAGRATHYAYDAVGRLTSVTLAVGTPVEATWQFEYDTLGNRSAVIDPLARVTRYSHDVLNRLVESVAPDPDGVGPAASPVMRYERDARGDVVRAVDPLGRSTRYAYDELRRLVVVVDPALETTAYQYDAAGNVARITDRLQRVTDYRHDDRGRLVETINAEGGRRVREYDADNNVTRVVDESFQATSYAYDARGRATRIVNALGGGVAYEYDAANNVTAVTDELARRTEFTYDELDRVVETTLPDPDGAGPTAAPRTRRELDRTGNLVREIDALGRVTELRYDARDRLVERLAPDPDGAGPLERPRSLLVYDAASRLLLATDPLGRETAYAYDDLDRVVQVVAPDPDGAGPESSPVAVFHYDAVGNVLDTTDALGRVTRREYDALDRLIVIASPDPDADGPLPSPVTTLAYDAESQLIAMTDALGRLTAHEYDRLGREVATTLPDPDGSVPDGAGPHAVAVWRRAYDAVGNLVTITDPLGSVTRFEYDALHRHVLTIGEDADGAAGPAAHGVERLEYDAASQLVAWIDALGRRTEIQHDSLGRVVRETLPDPDGLGPATSPVTASTFDLADRRMTTTDALGTTTEYAYDNLDRLTAIRLADPDGAGPEGRPEMTRQYDAAGQLVAETDALGRVTRFAWDGLGRLARVVAPDPDRAGPKTSPVTTYHYDAVGNLLMVEDPLGQTTIHEYDGLDRLVATIQADPDLAGPLASPVTRLAYDAAGQLLAATDPMGRVTTRAYDRLGRVASTTSPDPDGAGPLPAATTVFAYDLLGNRTAVIDPLGHATRIDYDRLHRPIRETEEDPDGAGPLGAAVTRTEYDLVGNAVTFVDPLGNVTRMAYDALDRLVVETIDLSSSRPPGDGRSRLPGGTSSSQPGGSETASRRFAYDALGQLVRRTDRLGRVIEYEHDLLYRQTAERWFDPAGALVGEFSFMHDAASQPLSAVDVTGGSRYDFTHDDLGRVTSTVIDNGGPLVVLASDHDAAGRRVSLSATVGTTLDFQNGYAFDRLDRPTRIEQQAASRNNLPPGITAVHDLAGKRIDLAWDVASQLTAITRLLETASGLGEVARSEFAYDEQRRLTALAHRSVATLAESVGALSPTTDLAGYTWTFDAADRITATTSLSDGAMNHQYDATNQLLLTTHDSSASSLADESFAYDAGGNRTGVDHVTGAYNRLVSDGAYDYAYDAEGNRVSRTDRATGAVVEYSWDHRNRLIRVVERATATAAPSSVVAHRYDVFDQWIARAVDSDGAGPGLSETTRFVHSDGQIILTLDDAGDVQHRYLWGPLVDQILADEFPPPGASGGPGGTLTPVGTRVLWPLTDHLGTVRDLAEFDPSIGASRVIAHRVYSAFGELLSSAAPESSSTSSSSGSSESSVVSSVDHLFAFTGRALDEATGLQNHLHRWYDARLGGWTSEDPAGFAAGDSNFYRYGGNSPATALDPDGLVDRSVRVAVAFGHGVGQGGLDFGHGILKTGRAGGDMAALVGLETYAGANAILRRATGDRLGLPGGDRAMDVARNVAHNSPFISTTMELRDQLARMTPEERAQLLRDLPGRMARGVKNWASDLADKLSRGCFEQVAYDLGKTLGETIPNLATGIGAQRTLKGLVKEVAGDVAGTFNDEFRRATTKRIGRLVQDEIGGVGTVAAYRRALARSERLPRVSTPYGPAIQSTSAAARQVRREVRRGATVYKAGVLGRSETAASQFLAAESPLAPGFASRYGLPPKNAKFEFVLGGRVRPGSKTITRAAPGIPPNPGGGIEVVVKPGDFAIEWFHMPDL